MNVLSSSKILTLAEISALHARHIAINNHDAYNRKYQTLPLELNQGWTWEGHDFPRIVSLLEFREYARKYHGFEVERALIMSGRDDPEMQYVRARHIDWRDHDTNTNANDLHLLNLPYKNYNFVMANQTLEHLYNPYLGLHNLFQHMAPGGLFYANVPALNIPHSVPFHFSTGFTPIGLAAMLHCVGFTILEIGQWGNFEYIEKLFRTHQWPDYRELKNYVNEFDNPVSTWALARK